MTDMSCLACKIFGPLRVTRVEREASLFGADGLASGTVRQCGARLWTASHIWSKVIWRPRRRLITAVISFG